MFAVHRTRPLIEFECHCRQPSKLTRISASTYYQLHCVSRYPSGARIRLFLETPSFVSSFGRNFSEFSISSTLSIYLSPTSCKRQPTFSWQRTRLRRVFEWARIRGGTSVEPVAVYTETKILADTVSKRPISGCTGGWRQIGRRNPGRPRASWRASCTTRGAVPSSSSSIEKLVFIAPLRPGLNHRCSRNFVVSSPPLPIQYLPSQRGPLV